MKISVIICTSNRPLAMGNLLRALLSQHRVPDELIIVEDRQGPQPRQAISDLRQRSIKVRYLRRSCPGLTASRNLALGHARGDLLSFFDDDTIPAPDFLRTVEQVFAADTTGQLGGLAPIIEPRDHRPGPGDILWQQLMKVASLWSLPYRRRQQIFSPADRFRFGLSHCSFLPGVVIYRREAIGKLRFDQRLIGYALGEDLDISFSLASRWQLYRCSHLGIRHHHDPVQRPSRFAMGKMFVRNLLYITCKHSGFGPGTLVVLLWQLTLLCFSHLLFVLLGNTRSHLAWLAGILTGLPWALANAWKTRTVNRVAPARSVYSHASARPRRRRVLFVINTLVPGGAERLTLALLKGLDSRRFDSSLICLQEPGSLAVELPGRVHFYHHLSRHKFDLSVLPAMVKLILRGRIDLLVSVGNGGDRMFWSSLACLLTARPLVTWCHSYPTATEPTFEWPNRLLQFVTNTFVAVRPSQAHALKQILHIPPARIRLIENALPDAAHLAAEKTSSAKRCSFRSELNLPVDAFLIVTVANLRPIKGYDVLIDAAAEVLGRGHDVYFLFVGQGPQLPALRGQIHHRQIDHKRIIFLGQRSDVAQLLRCCDLFVLSSYSESFGLAVLEAQAAALPVIATATPGSADLIQHDRTGLLVPAGQAKQLAKAITALLSDPERRGELASQAYLFAGQKRFAPAKMIMAFEELFELLA